MFTVPLKDVRFEHIQKLLEDQVPESKILDYKKELPLLEQDKVEFLRDVSSFANTVGGYLIYGVEEKGSIPTAIPGVVTDDKEKSINRFDQMLNTGLERKLHGYNYQWVDIPDKKYVLIIQIPKSWDAPHGVKDGIRYSFYGRNASSKYPYDIQGIKSAFNLTHTIKNQIESFRAHRINKIFANEAAMPLSDNPKIVLHLLPISAFDSNSQLLNIEPILNDYTNKLPLVSRWSSMDRRRNLDGLLVYGKPEQVYSQLYRSGIVEIVDSYTMNKEIMNGFLPTDELEKNLVKALEKYLNTLKNSNIFPPIYVGLSLLGVKYYKIHVDPWKHFEGTYPIEQDILQLPLFECSDFSCSSSEILKTSFDLIWNACGFKGSSNYDVEGNWKFTN